MRSDGLAAMLVLLDMFLWLAALNALFTLIGWLLERPAPPLP